MENKRPVRCKENEDVSLYLWAKWQEMAQRSGFSESLDMTLSNAYRNICCSKTPIKSLKDLSQIKGIGKWIVRLMHEFFPDDPPAGAPQTGKKANGPKRYVPQKNSVAYALLITLYRGFVNDVTFMKKQELIDATEASGLSSKSVRSDKVKGKPGQFRSSARDWYTGWSCMKTLISKGLVAKSACPAKYMLTQEGQEIARECVLRSGLSDSQPPGCLSHSSVDKKNFNTISVVSIDDEPMLEPSNISIRERVDDSSMSFLGEKFQSSLESVDSGFKVLGNDCPTTSTSRTFLKEGNGKDKGIFCVSKCSNLFCISETPISLNSRACTSSGKDLTLQNSCQVGAHKIGLSVLTMPPSTVGDKFEEIYDVILILDDRENFGSRKEKVVDIIRSQFNILVEVRRLPVGDGIWIARHKETDTEYVLDFIVERKKVDDLCSSIRDNRYRDQKLRLQRCGLKKLIYLVEGDLSTLDAAESIKTACFTTEILEGFDVQRTTGFADTVRRYGHLSLSIKQYYAAQFSAGDASKNNLFCPIFNEFVKRCQELQKVTVSDVFALQLMQVPLVTEEIALAVTDLYPTPISLARAYSILEGNVPAQQEFLKNQSKIISIAASKSIFKLVWGS